MTRINWSRGPSLGLRKEATVWIVQAAGYLRAYGPELLTFNVSVRCAKV